MVALVRRGQVLLDFDVLDGWDNELSQMNHGKVGVIQLLGYLSTISRRINRLEIKINEKLGNDIVIALDSTGIKVANRGEWMRHKWHVREGYLKIHVAVDIKNKRI